MEIGDTPNKPLPTAFTRTPIRNLNSKRQGLGHADLLRSKDTPELYRLDNPFNQYQNSNSKWNEQTPVRFIRENLFKLQESDSKKRIDTYPNRKNSVMTELIHSATIEEEMNNRFSGMGTSGVSSIYIPESNYQAHKNGRQESNHMRIKEEIEDDNLSFNSGCQDVRMTKNLERMRGNQQRAHVSGGGESGFQKILFPNAMSPQNFKLFQSPIQRTKNGDETADMMLECRDFFDRSYSKLLQSHKKNRESNNKATEWDNDIHSKNRYIIQNYLDSNQKQKNHPKNQEASKNNVKPFQINNRHFSFAIKNLEKNNYSTLSNLNSQIGPNMSKLNLTLSPTNSFRADSFMITSTERDRTEPTNLANLFLNAKNEIEKRYGHPMNIVNQNSMSKKSNFYEMEGRRGNRRSANGKGNKQNSFSELPVFGSKSKEQFRNSRKGQYLVDEIKEAVLNSNSNLLLSNFQGSLSSLSNKKLIQFTNSEKKKKKTLTSKQSKSNSKENPKKKNNKIKSSSIDIKNRNNKGKSGLLFMDSTEKVNIQPHNSLVPLDQSCKSISQSSNIKQTTLHPNSKGLFSPFLRTPTPLPDSLNMPSTASNTLSNPTKLNKKQFDQVLIKHFDANPSTRQNTKAMRRDDHLLMGTNINFKEDRFGGDFNVTIGKIKNREKTPDPVARKLGKRGGSDAKKCQTPGSFLGSIKKQKKKVRKV
jgi:hypothetical protein